MQQTDENKYLGMWMNLNGCVKAKNEKISMVNQWVGRLYRERSKDESKYDVLREAWKSVAVPSIMYGMDVIVWNENQLEKLEVGLNRVARVTAIEAL
ncbi:hypothetical protein E2C01_052700 [Portunus trituberculatus]|uniref:Uncharacterized protein n=1 Tax=Portunus trituberculatus TaxID=210409 RepID=A0A5B7GMG6_PORTR|nr:hypothetical protein [Portunus trituberculatus]